MKTTQHKHVPALRFPEFNGEWKRRRLGNVIGSYRLGGNYANTDTKTKHPLIKMGNLGRGRINLVKIEYIKQGEKIYEDDLIKPGDLFFNTRNTLDLVGKVAIWRDELKIAYYNSNLMRIMFDNNFFMNDQLNSPRGIKNLRRIATGTTSVAAIYNKDLLKVWLFIPRKEEQQKIATFLSAVDTKIEQLNNKKSLWEQYKKGMMQKLFSQEVRFKDEQGKDYPGWEEVRAAQVFTNHTNKKHSSNLPILSATQDRGVIPRNETGLEIQSSAKSIASYKVIEPGDFVISLRSFQGGIEYSKYLGIGSPAYTILKPSVEIACDFFKFYFKKEDFISRLNNTIIGIRDGKQIPYSDFAAMKLGVPSLKEQQKIATFLSTIDQKIELVTTELKQARTFKKGLLQQMFI